MRYEIKGTPLPVVELELSSGETVICEGGAMSWMSPNMHMETTAGGLGKILSKTFSGEKIFQNRYTPVGGSGYIAFASSFPGNIVAVEIGPGREVICQKKSFLASSAGVELSIHFQKKVGSGLFGGEGFIMQKLSGTGIAFLEVDGSTEVKYLAPGEQIIIDTGYLAMMDATCSMDIVSVKGAKNMLFGGESLFNTVVTGPGNVTLQTMPASAVAGAIIPYIPTSSN